MGSRGDTRSECRRPVQVGRWRVVDLVVVAVIGVAFGVVYWAWNQLWLITSPLFVAFPPAQASLYGVWLLPPTLAAFVVRRSKAAIFGGLSAAIVSMFLGNVWGLTVIFYGFVQGLIPELVFAVTRYRVWNWVTAGIATMLAAGAAATLDLTLFYPLWQTGWKSAYAIICMASGLVMGAVLVPLLLGRLRRTGVLDEMPSS